MLNKERCKWLTRKGIAELQRSSRVVRDQEVAGSNPVTPIILRNEPFGEYVEGLFHCEDASYKLDERVQMALQSQGKVWNSFVCLAKRGSNPIACFAVAGEQVTSVRLFAGIESTYRCVHLTTAVHMQGRV